jgi:hypothetical protein
MGRLIARGWITRERVEAMLLKGAGQCVLLTDDGLQQCRATIEIYSNVIFAVASL